MNIPFSEKLRMLIEERNLKQKQVALDLQMAPSTLGGYVQGASEPDLYTVTLFADYFGVSTDFLLSHRTADTRSDLEEDLLRVFRSMSAHNQKVFLEQGKVLVRLKYVNDSLSSK